MSNKQKHKIMNTKKMNAEERKDFIETQLANLEDQLREVKQAINDIEKLETEHINSEEFEQKINVRLQHIRNDHQFWVNTINSDINVYLIKH